MINFIYLSDVLLQHKKKYTIDDVPNFKDIIAFECRGSTIVEFKFGVSMDSFESINYDQHSVESNGIEYIHSF